ncbi:adenylate/guanylate cyclase domain-containing protein [Patulibacter defluvii]|uniref:adenylate/guanylate cyclase domain-containing protein n=1 Tax=Patulibacter defluvii TaxID=3095358 RepID=UPI002A753FA1|nr:adenylate/guanylate cyclase domain-containing protein [Patulibacter sp. DM4]
MTDRDDEPLLAGLEGEQRDARAALLRDLRAAGAGEQELEEAAARGRLVLLPVERTLRGTPTLTTADLVRRTGVDPELLERALQAAGMPIPAEDERAWNERDLALARLIARLVAAGVAPDAVVDLGRTLGEAGARIGAAAIVGLGASLTREDDREDALAARLTEATLPTVEELGDALAVVVRERSLDQLARIQLSREQIAEGRLAGATQVTIGFADVVGFTRMGEELGAERLQDVAVRLAALGEQAATADVRVVKTIGDAVMLAGADPAAVVAVLLDLQQRVAADPEFPRIRAGAATGDGVPRAGDWFGPAVNRASRVCSTARPGTLLIDDATRVLIDDDAYAWRTIGRMHLKGVGRVLLHRVRPVDR